MSLALSGKVSLYLSPYVLDEIRDVASRPKLVARFKLREDRVQALLDNLPKAAIVLSNVPDAWKYERDPDDAHYVNLALAADARLIVSRDKDLLDLMKASSAEGRTLRLDHPTFQVLTPP